MKDIPSEDRGQFARDVYTYAHAPIVAGVIVAAAALEEITLHPADTLPFEFRGMLVLGLVLYLVGIESGVYRAYHVVPPERFVLLVVIAALVLPDIGVSGLVLLILVDAAILVALAGEHYRVEVTMGRTTSGAD